MKRLKDNNDVPEARHGTLPKTNKLQANEKATFYSLAEEWVLPVVETKRAVGRRVCGGFRSEYAHDQQERS